MVLTFILTMDLEKNPNIWIRKKFPIQFKK